MALEILAVSLAVPQQPGHGFIRAGDLPEQKYLWLAALAFHWSLLVILVRHLRLLVEPVPAVAAGDANAWTDSSSSARRRCISPTSCSPCALAYLLLRRFRDPMVRYISQFSDYFALLGASSASPFPGC